MHFEYILTNYSRFVYFTVYVPSLLSTTLGTTPVTSVSPFIKWSFDAKSFAPGLIPSLLLSSTQFFVTVISITSGVWVLVIVSPFFAAVLSAVYPSTPSSLIVYSMAFPSLFFCKLAYLTVYVPSLLSITSAVAPFTSAPSPRRWSFALNASASGLIPSWLFPSSHLLIIVISVVSGVWTFVIVPPFTALLLSVAYPAIAPSLTVYVMAAPFSFLRRFEYVITYVLSAPIVTSGVTSVISLSPALRWSSFANAVVSGLTLSWSLLSSHFFVTTPAAQPPAPEPAVYPLFGPGSVWLWCSSWYYRGHL